MELMKNLFSYNNYKQYLYDYYVKKKKEQANSEDTFSYRKYAKLFGFKSDGYLIEIIQGKKDASQKAAGFFAKFFEFSFYERLYWDALVSYNNTNDKFYLEVMKMAQTTEEVGI